MTTHDIVGKLWNQPNLNLSKIKEFPLSLPGITEQAETSAVSKRYSPMPTASKPATPPPAPRSKKLTPATLAKAFRGELVPQDPNDEPASALLERIHAQCKKPRAGKPSRSSREQG